MYNKPKFVNQYYKNPYDYFYEFLHTKSDDIYQLGIFFQNEYTAKKDIDLAIKLFKLSSQFQNSKALVKLGNIYEYSFDITRDLSRAEYYYKKA